MKECPACNLCYDNDYNTCPKDGEALFISYKCGTTLCDRYILERRLGKGGMAAVYKAKHKLLKSLHAIKIISPEVVREDETLLIRFRQEAILAASIHHPNVVNVTDFGVENENMPFLVMEYIEGITLDDYLRKEKRLSPAKALEILRPIALGVGEAHKKGITHRDLKPLNVMLRNGMPLTQAVKVLDFGLAKIKSTESFASLVQAKTTSLLGSPQYMSPEQWANEDIDARADIYSMGVMLYQMLAGDFPFHGDSILTVMYQHLHNSPPSLASLGVSVSPQIESVIQKALAKEREQRQATAEEFLNEYEDAILGKGNANVTIPNNRVPVNRTTNYSSASENQIPTKKYTDKDFTKTYTLPYLTPTQNETLSTFFNQPKILESEEAKGLAERFIDAQARVEQAQIKVNEAEKLIQNYNEELKAAEEAYYKIMQAGRRLEEEMRQQMEADAEGKLTVEAEERRKAERERYGSLEKQALEGKQNVNAARLLVEREIQKREQAEASRVNAENEVRRLAEEIIEAQKQLDEAQKLPGFEYRQKEKSGKISSPNLRGDTYSEINNQPPEQRLADTSFSSISHTSKLFGSKPLNYLFVLTGISLILVSSFGGYLIYRYSVGSSTNISTSSNKLEDEASKSQNGNSQLPDRVKEKMVYIEGGTFQIGRNDVNPSMKEFGVQFPAYSVNVNSFYIDRTEVTNEEYAEFVNAKRYKPPDNWQNGKISAGQEKFPVTNVSNFDAREFADWISKRDKIKCQLPTEEEWEYAARNGNQQNIYPWGNEWIPGRANIDSDSPKEVGTTDDETARGKIKEMMGNVMEWTFTTFRYYPEFPKKNEDPNLKANIFPTVRGASFAATDYQIKNKQFLLTHRQGVTGDMKSPYLGFRLVCQSNSQ